MRRAWPVFVVALAAIHAASLQAGRVQTWRQSTEAEFLEGTLDGAVVTSTGELMLARGVELLADLEAEFVWDLAELPDGSLIAATADPGQIVRIPPSGTGVPPVNEGDDPVGEAPAEPQPQVLLRDETAQVFAVAAAPDGTVFAGTGPQGRIYRVAAAAEGETPEPEVLHETGAEYVWDLVYDDQANCLYAATGPGGRLLRVGLDGSAEVVYEARQSHVLCLALADGGALYAGTDSGGVLYRFTGQRPGEGPVQPFVVYDASQEEIRALHAAADGTLWAATGSGREGGASGQVGENAIYRIDAAGGVREVFKKRAIFFALAETSVPPDGQREAPAEPPATNWLVAASGPDGILYAVATDGRSSAQWTEVDAEQILALVARSDGSLALGTGGGGQVHVLRPEFAEQGTLITQVFDAEHISRWGSLEWDGELPEGAHVRIELRSGNVEQPEDTWSPWCEARRAGSAGEDGANTASEPGHELAADCPAARFLQARLTLTSGGEQATPVVRSVAVRYQTINQPPQLASVTVPQVEDADDSEEQGDLELSWSASDPNGDALRYALYFRQREWRNWVRLADDLEEAEYTWDSTSVPEGVYELRVVATDRADNAEDEAMESERVSEPFIIDRTAPEVEVRVGSPPCEGDGPWVIEVTASDTLTHLVRAAYAVDGGGWVSIFPEDGLFDQQHERLRFELRNLDAGTHVLAVRVVDAAGHTGVEDVVLEVAGDNGAAQSE